MLPIVLLFCLFASSHSLSIISRSGWGAKAAKGTTRMANPVPYVVIHHSDSPGVCLSQADCIKAMQQIQNYHQNTNGWDDIGYSFAVGGDGYAYEGRGWSAVGAHAPGYNSNSIGICVIGNWMTALPQAKQLQAVHELIQYGVSQGLIRSDYQLIGHRQVKATDCPGDRLFQEISGWPHFSQIV